MLIRILFTGLLLLSAAIQMHAQSRDTTAIVVRGVLRDEMDQPIPNAIIINRSTKKGSFGKPNGSFELKCQRGDTLAITSLGYQTRYVTYTDSITSTEFKLKLYLETRTYMLSEVEVFAPRDLEQIQEDILKLGYNEKDYMLSGINAAASPITFLYQQFSTYLNVSDEFLIQCSQYDFLVYVKDRFRDYKIYLRQNQRMKSADFDYDKD